MSNFPISLDDDTTLPFVSDNITEIGGEAINALREATFALEQNLGIGAAGTLNSLSERLGVSIAADGTIKSSALTSLGLVTLPITNNQIANNAGIPESKLVLDHRTQDLFNYITDLSGDVNSALGWISTSGVKLDPHLVGAIYRHSLEQIDVDPDPSKFFKNKFKTLRNNNDSYTVIDDLNNDFLNHQWADGIPQPSIGTITTNGGSQYPSSYGHTASGIFIDTSRFAVIPQTADDLQLFANFLDDASIFLLGTRIQNLYTNGISRVSRSSSLTLDGYGQAVIPPTPAIAYLKQFNNLTTPWDDIDTGDDIIEFKPASIDMTNNTFDEKFGLVKVGDIIRINYGTIEVPFVIKEKKYIDGGSKKYLVRIAGKNIMYSNIATARIDKPLVNSNKYGALALAPANCSESLGSIPGSLIVGSPRGAQVTGIDFNPDQLDSTHWALYLVLYPTGNPLDGQNILPAIDVTGNKGVTPGAYTLNSVVEQTNAALRKVGYNFRFIAFSYQGEFGIMLADSYNNASFSIINAIVASNGTLDQTNTNLNYPNNVIDLFPTSTFTGNDALGIGPNGSNVASPPLLTTYGSTAQAAFPTKIFIPLKRNNYYVNGVEKEKLNIDVLQLLDTYGDGYWIGTILAPVGPPSTDKVDTTYRVTLDLSASKLKIGKTLVVQSLGESGIVDFGRFIIKSINFSCDPLNTYTDIQVFDAVHASGVSPVPTLAVGSKVAIYFSSDSVSINQESATDINNNVRAFKRHLEIYVDQNGMTYSHERARMNILSVATVNGITMNTFSELAKMDLVKVSPKLRGYQFGTVNKITLNIFSYDDTTGKFTGQLEFFDSSGPTTNKSGPLTVGRKGEIVRFYDETNIDFIDIIFDINTTFSTFTNQLIDIQLFPSLSLDQEIMLLGTCQFNDLSHVVNYVRDERQFGNTSEKDLSTSALNFLSTGDRLLHENGVIRGFDLSNVGVNPNPNSNQIYLTGGMALVNGKFIQMNADTVTIPYLKDTATIFITKPDINWALCVNDRGEYQPIPLLDHDPALLNSNSPNRVFKVFNPDNSLTYNLDASTFSDIVNNRKDLTILYIVRSLIPTIGSRSLILTDARKYANDTDSILDLKLTPANSQGNFKNVISIFNWIKFNNVYNSYAIVRGANTDNATIPANIFLELSFTNTTVIDGENNAILTMNGPVTLGSNLILKNLRIDFNGGLFVQANLTNLVLDHCEINITNPTGSPPSANTLFKFLNSVGVTIKDCNITVQYNSADQASGGAVFKFTDASNINISDTNILVTFAVTPGTTYPGDVIQIAKTQNTPGNSPNILINNVNATGNFNKFVNIDCTIAPSNNIKIIGGSATSDFNPQLGPDLDYVDTDLVNSCIVVSSNVTTSNGYINVIINSVTLSGLIIDGVTFNYSSLFLKSVDRFSFINCVLAKNDSILIDSSIINCKFNNLNCAPDLDDRHAAISIINAAQHGQFKYAQPLLSNVKIENNSCDKGQLIIVTSRPEPVSSIMEYPGLVASGVTIKNNICGAIGYWVNAASKMVNIIPNINSRSDKDSGLHIDENTCHYIATMYHNGAHFVTSLLQFGVTTNVSDYPSGNVTITNNQANWIHVAISHEENSILHILNNDLTAYDQDYLNYYLDNAAVSSAAGNGGSYGYAIFVSARKHVAAPVSNPGEGNDSNCIISGNTTNPGYWIESNLTLINYQYPVGYIYCQSSFTCNNNILKGIGNAVLGTAILAGGINSIITNNKIFRYGDSIFAYIGWANFEVPYWNGGTDFETILATGIITNNYLDQPTTDGTNEVVINTNGFVAPSTVLYPNSGNWIVERNKNQTVTMSIPIKASDILFTGDNVALNSLHDLQNTPSVFYIKQQPGNDAKSAYKSLILQIYDVAHSPTVERHLGWNDTLDKYIPNGAKLVRVQLAVATFNSVVETPLAPPSGYDSKFILSINRYATAQQYLAIDTSAIANSVTPDPYILNDPPPLGQVNNSTLTGAAINAAGASALLMDIDLTIAGTLGTDISHLFTSGNGSPFGVSLDLAFKLAGFFGALTFDFSPMLVKYRW